MTYCNSRDVAYDHVEEDDEQEAECGAFTSGSLSVHFGERERSAAVDDSVEIRNTVQDCDGVAESCDQTQRDLGKNGLGKIDLGVG